MGFKTAQHRRDYLRARYNKIMNELRDLHGGKCVKCGSNQDLDFDHIDPSTKSASISKLVASSNKVNVIKELSKCQLLCKSCHTLKTVSKQENVSNKFQWIITKKDGEIITCHNLSKWARLNGYKIHTLRDIARNRNPINCDIKSISRLIVKDF